VFSSHFFFLEKRKPVLKEKTKKVCFGIYSHSENEKIQVKHASGILYPASE